MIIDFHTHYYPEALAERALAEFHSLGKFKASTDATRSGLEKSMRRAGIDISLSLPLAWKPENVKGINRWAALHSKHPIYILGTVHPDVPDPEEIIRQIAGYGLKGIKLHPEFQQFTFDDPRIEKIAKACIKHNIFILTHTGGDIQFPPPPNSNPEQLARFHRRFPDLKLILAHLGSWGLWDEIEQHLVGLPIYLDLAFVIGFIDDDKLIRIIKKHGSHRIIFGTDSPWRDQKKYVDYIRQLPLNKTETENIFWRNAAKLLDLPNEESK